MSGSDFVVLTAGPTLPLEAVQLAMALEERGCSIRLDGDVLVVGPRERITEDDRRAIRRWRTHLMALAAYQAPSIQ